jgi:hypothetical protein
MPSRQPDRTWPFADPPTATAFTCWRILRGEEWIHYVTRDEAGGGWRFQPHGLAPQSESAVVALREIVALDPSVRVLADLPAGWCAWRDRKGAPWVRAQRGPDER